MSRIASRRSRGQTLVEFALVLPMLLLFLLGILDLGRAVYAYSTISNAAREAARLAIVSQAQGTACPAETVECTAAQHAASLDLDPAAQVHVDFRNPDDPNDPGNDCIAIDIGCIAVVTVEYRYTAATPVIGNLVGVIDMSSTTMLPIEAKNP
jgi:hypothetical protein